MNYRMELNIHHLSVLNRVFTLISGINRDEAEAFFAKPPNKKISYQFEIALLSEILKEHSFLKDVDKARFDKLTQIFTTASRLSHATFELSTQAAKVFMQICEVYARLGHGQFDALLVRAPQEDLDSLNDILSGRCSVSKEDADIAWDLNHVVKRQLEDDDLPVAMGKAKLAVINPLPNPYQMAV